MVMERWKWIKDYKGLYSASTEGRIWSYRRTGTKGGFLKASPNEDGYPMVQLCKNGKIKAICTHIIVAKTFIPNPEQKPLVNHKDGVKTNCQKSNLEWCTHAENEEHAKLNGLKAKGDRHGNTKIPDRLIPSILRRIKKDVPLQTIADDFNVTRQAIWLIGKQINRRV